MNEYEMIVMVVFIIAFAAVVIALIARGSRSAGAPNRDLVADNRRLEGEVGALKDRVAVLERIATDKNHRLEHEFERLRDN